MPAPLPSSDADQAPASATVPPTPGGLVLAPFRGLRYAATGELAANLGPVTSPPYDVLDNDDVSQLEQRHPHNIVRLILPRDEPNAPGSRYRRAARTLAQWRRADVLRPDADPALYVYEESGAGHVQRGLLGAVGLTPPAAGIVLPHENTMAGPVADRLALTEAIEANPEPIFLVYDGGGAASAAVAAAGADGQPPLLVAATEDGLTHRLWALTDSPQLAAIAADLYPRRAVIADGHHRYATYLRHQRDRHEAGAGPGPWDYGLTMLVDATMFGPQVHAIHRVVPTLPLAAAVAAAADAFTVAPLAGGLPTLLAALATAREQGPAFVLADTDTAYLLTDPAPGPVVAALDPTRSAAWRSLDVSLAHSLLITACWRLPDTEDVVDFRHDAAGAVAAAGNSGTALLLAPTPVADVLAVAAAGERMPRKSTLFTPKPRTGIVLRAFADNAVANNA